MNSYIFMSIIIAFLYGIQPIMHKQLLLKYDVITIMILTELIYMCCLLYVGYSNKDKLYDDIVNMNKNDIYILLFVSIVTVFLTDMLYYYVLKDNDCSVISALIYCSLIFTILISYYFYNEQLNYYSYVGIVLILLGVTCISLSG